MIKVAVDAMGGDYGLNSTVKASMDAIKEIPDLEIVLYGKKDEITPLLTDSTRISIVDAKTVIDMGEHNPVKAIRTMKDSSLCMAFQAGKDKEVDAVVTSGPTQCVVVGAHLIVRKIPQMSRIALCPVIPNFDGHSRLLLDCGANVELKPEHLVQLAIYGTVVAREVLGVKDPKVGLLNIGTEEGKGREQDKLTYELLSNCKDVNFYGNVESSSLMDSPVDVMLTDGFTGNMCMKTCEGTAKIMSKMLKQEIKSSLGGKIGALFMKKNLKHFKKRMDSKEVGGAMILGIGVPIVKAHGNSDAYAFKNAIKQVYNMAKKDVVGKVINALPKDIDEKAE